MASSYLHAISMLFLCCLYENFSPPRCVNIYYGVMHGTCAASQDHGGAVAPQKPASFPSEATPGGEGLPTVGHPPWGSMGKVESVAMGKVDYGVNSDWYYDATHDGSTLLLDGC